MGRKKKKQKKEEAAEEKSKPKFNLASDAKRSAAAIALLALAVIMMLGFFNSAGAFGEFLNKIAASAIGWSKFIFPIFLIISGIVLLLRKETAFYVTKIIGLGIILLSFTGLSHWFFDSKEMFIAAQAGQGGGYIGFVIVYILEKYLGNAGSFVVISALAIIGAIVTFEFSLIQIIAKIFSKKETEGGGEGGEDFDGEEEKKQGNVPDKSQSEDPQKLQDKEKKEDMEVEKNISHIEFVDGRDQFVDSKINSQYPIDENFKGKTSDGASDSQGFGFSRNSKSKKWTLPPTDLLEKSFGTAKGGDIENNFSVIEKTLKDFGIDVERGGIKTGPSVTQYSFRPAVGVKIAKILSLQNDLSLALAAPIRIEAPIPGQSLIGIEIPNKVSTLVRLRDMVEEGQFRRRESNLTLAMGEDVSGNRIFSDLSKMPHLLVAGSTGTGKSVSINSIIATLLYQNSPEDLKLIMVDPKRVELSLFNGIPHLLTDVVVENGKVVNVLKWAVGEMEKRYRMLQDTGSRDIASYREKMKIGKKIRRVDSETGKITEEDLKNLPYIVIIIDELADLMGSHGKEVEGAIVRIAQMARAVGIHLVISTQRPSVEVITGLIKANITTRIAFQVATQIDSRTIIDMGGAEKLLGNGDMLYLSSASPKPKRVQGVFINESEVRKVVKFIKEQDKNRRKEKKEEKEDITEKPDSQKEILEFKEKTSDFKDDLLEEAKAEVIRAKKASASLLQRRLRIGYARAARILDILEDKGIVGPSDGSKPREVYGISENETPEYENGIDDQEKRDKWQM